MARPDFDIATATDEELAAALRNKEFERVYYSISAEISRRIEERKEAAQLAKLNEPFNARTEISADAKYLWNKIFIWFWLVPVGAALLWWMVNLK